jgi:CHAD domain-containing protein
MNHLREYFPKFRPQPMNMSRDRTALAFHKLSRQISKLSEKPKPEYVHRFRTLSRRVEALLEGLVADPAGNDKKLLVLLARLRKKAGKVRDLDVQISILRALRIPQDRARKTELIQALCDERQKREARLASAFDEHTLRELGRRLKRASKALPLDGDPLQPALRQLEDLTRIASPITEATLHRYRILGKRVRYLAEQCPDNAQAYEIVPRLKQVQDAIGDWHDWLKLTEKANKFFASAPNSGLLSTLRAISRNKFLQAVDVLTRARANFSSPAEGRKPTGTAAAVSARSAIA